MTQAAVAVLGTGRVGLTLARALVLSGTPVRLLARRTQAALMGLPPVDVAWGPALAEVRLIIVAVPDDAIASVAAQLAALQPLGAQHVVLHTSGLHGVSALAPLRPSGAALGSLHPLQTFPAGGGAAELLRGIPAIVEGDVRAVTAARELAGHLAMDPVLELSAEGKVRYHAAAVVASNYLVVLAEIAERLAREAGGGELATRLFQPIMSQTLASIAERGTEASLTGPVRRGDVGTVRAHLAVLRGNDRVVYVALGREALALARRGGLSASTAAELETLLSEDPPRGA